MVALGGDAEWNGCYTPSLIVEGPSTTGKSKKEFMWPPALTQRFRQWLRPQRASAIAEACLIGLVAALSAVLLKVERDGFGQRVQASHLLPASCTTSSRTFVRCSLAYCLSGWHQKRAVAVFLTSSTLANVPINLPGAWHW